MRERERERERENEIERESERERGILAFPTSAGLASSEQLPSNVSFTQT